MPERFMDWLTAGKPHVTRLSMAAGISTRTLTAPGKALTYEYDAQAGTVPDGHADTGTTTLKMHRNTYVDYSFRPDRVRTTCHTTTKKTRNSAKKCVKMSLALFIFRHWHTFC